MIIIVWWIVVEYVYVHMYGTSQHGHVYTRQHMAAPHNNTEKRMTEQQTIQKTQHIYRTQHIVIRHMATHYMTAKQHNQHIDTQQYHTHDPCQHITSQFASQHMPTNEDDTVQHHDNTCTTAPSAGCGVHLLLLLALPLLLRLPAAASTTT